MVFSMNPSSTLLALLLLLLPTFGSPEHRTCMPAAHVHAPRLLALRGGGSSSHGHTYLDDLLEETDSDTGERDAPSPPLHAPPPGSTVSSQRLRAPEPGTHLEPKAYRALPPPPQSSPNPEANSVQAEEPRRRREPSVSSNADDAQGHAILENAERLLRERRLMLESVKQRLRESAAAAAANAQPIHLGPLAPLYAAPASVCSHSSSNNSEPGGTRQPSQPPGFLWTEGVRGVGSRQGPALVRGQRIEDNLAVQILERHEAVLAHTHTHTHAHRHTHTRTCKHTHTHTHTHSLSLSHTHTCTYRHTHTHAHTHT